MIIPVQTSPCRNKIRANIKKSINHFKDSAYLTKRQTRNGKAIHADVLLAAIIVDTPINIGVSKPKSSDCIELPTLQNRKSILLCLYTCPHFQDPPFHIDISK